MELLTYLHENDYYYVLKIYKNFENSILSYKANP